VKIIFQALWEMFQVSLSNYRKFRQKPY